jgi:Ca2+-binding EF-hand superfamily protein
MGWNIGPHLERRRKVESGLDGGWTTCNRARKGGSYFSRDTDIEELIDILRAKYGTLTRAWRVALDADESGLLDFREFSSALQSIGYVGNMRTLWFNLDDDNSGAISLKEIDPQAYASLEKFRAMAGKHYGGIINCWHQLLDQDKSGTVSFEEFHEALPELGYDDEDEEEELFNYLLTTPGIRYITIHDVMFLQKWEETKSATAFRKRLRKGWVNKDPYMSNNPSKAGSVCGGLTANPSMTTLGAATSISASVVEDYGSVTVFDEEQNKEAFRKFLIDKFGTLCKA